PSGTTSASHSSHTTRRCETMRERKAAMGTAAILNPRGACAEPSTVRGYATVCFPAAEVSAMSQPIDKEQVVGVLNRLLEAELAGVVRYTHYSFLVFGFARIPIVAWLREQADESQKHRPPVGSWMTT